MADLDITQLLKLGEDLEKDAHRAASETYPVVRDLAKELEKTWRDNAKATARKHGRHYPRSITAEQIPVTDGPMWEVGPETRRKQGSMGRGFEYGSVNQPPHLDGTRAATTVEPKLEAAIKKIFDGFLA